MSKLSTKYFLVLLIAALVVMFFVFDFGRFFTLEYLQAQQQSFLDYYHQNQILTIAVYFLVYVAVTALSLPGAAVMTLAGGALFGLLVGTIVVSFASTIGATLAFLVSRFLLRDYVQSKFGDRLKVINEGIKKEGAFYLFTLRLIPVFPFFVINLVMGMTPIKTIKFFLVSQIGMLAGTVVYVNAGDQLASITSLNGIFSPALLASFALLGLLPLIAKKIVDIVRSKKRQRIS